MSDGLGGGGNDQDGMAEGVEVSVDELLCRGESSFEVTFKLEEERAEIGEIDEGEIGPALDDGSRDGGIAVDGEERFFWWEGAVKFFDPRHKLGMGLELGFTRFFFASGRR